MPVSPPTLRTAHYHSSALLYTHCPTHLDTPLPALPPPATCSLVTSHTAPAYNPAVLYYRAASRTRAPRALACAYHHTPLPPRFCRAARGAATRCRRAITTAVFAAAPSPFRRAFHCAVHRPLPPSTTRRLPCRRYTLCLPRHLATTLYGCCRSGFGRRCLVCAGGVAVVGATPPATYYTAACWQNLPAERARALRAVGDMVRTYYLPAP